MKPIPRFQYHSPKTLDEALQLMNTLDTPKPLIGGTDLLPLMREATCIPSNLVDLNNVTELNYLNEKDGFICIGATTTLSQILASKYVKRAHAIVEAVNNIGSPQIRNRGTITGNLCNASPAADSAPSLLVYDAEVRVMSINEERIIPVQELFAGPKINSLEPNELVTEIRFLKPSKNSASSFKRIGRRKSFTLSIVSAATYLRMDGETCVDARIAFGSVAETPIRVPEIENILKNKVLYNEAVSRAGAAAKKLVRPITDVRGTAEYRKDMCDVLLVRALNTAKERAR